MAGKMRKSQKFVKTCSKSIEDFFTTDKHLSGDQWDSNAFVVLLTTFKTQATSLTETDSSW